MRPIHTPCLVILLSLSNFLAACKQPKQDEPRGTPPPTESTTDGACSQGGGTVGDDMTTGFFPRSFSTYCVDPNGETRSYGRAAGRDVDAICLEAFNGDCEVYKSFGLDRVVLFRYIDGAGSPGAVDVVVSRYTTAEGALGMFTKRIISEADPAREDAPREMALDGIGALGAGTAYLWKGQIVVELTYTNDRQTPQQMFATGGDLLKLLGAMVAGNIPGSGVLPAAARKLPSENRIPLGLAFQPKDAFDVFGGGAGAVGYYREGAKRYRVLSIARDDADQTADVLTALLKREGATRVKDLGDGAVRLMVGDVDDGRAEWIVARSGSQVFGVGDEPAVLKPGMSGTDRGTVSLTKDEKVARVKGLLAAR